MVITNPKPYCPICGAQMVLRQPRPGSMKHFEQFWGCSQYPNCWGKRNIDPETGSPIEDEYDEADLGDEDPCTDWGRD